MKYSEIPDFPFTMGDPDASRFGDGTSTGPPNSFMVNNSNRQIDDESLGYLVEYMELDEFLDECDLRLDAIPGDNSVTELDIDGFLSTKDDPVPFEIQPNQLGDQVEAQKILTSTPENQNNKRRRVSSCTSVASNSNSSTGSTTSIPSNLLIKTDFGGINGLRSPGAPTFQEIRIQQQQQQQQPQTGSTQQTSQIILPPKQQNKKPQAWPNSQTPQPSRVTLPGPSSPTKQPRKTQRKRQQSAPAPISAPLQVDSAVVANTNITVQTTQTMQQKLNKSIFIVAPPQVPLGTLSPIVQVATPTTAAPETDNFEDDSEYVDPEEPNFAIPESPGTPGGSKGGKRKRKQTISDTMKDDKYWERRRKNNAAAKRSREDRLAKEAKIALQANCLVQENIKLKEELKTAIDENKSLRVRLQNYELNDA